MLSTLTDQTGAITAFPAQQKKSTPCSCGTCSARLNADTARLRRSPVE